MVIEKDLDSKSVLEINLIEEKLRHLDTKAKLLQAEKTLLQRQLSEIVARKVEVCKVEDSRCGELVSVSTDSRKIVFTHK